jgi:hypothetical protein
MLKKEKKEAAIRNAEAVRKLAMKNSSRGN